MKSKVVGDADVVTYVVVCDPGDEAVGALSQFARDERLEASQITAVGAFEPCLHVRNATVYTLLERPVPRPLMP